MSAQAHSLRAVSRSTAVAAGIAVFVAGLILAPSVSAATPKAGCWGTCGGDEGPVGGFFMVANHKIVGGISIELKCLGTQRIPQPVGPPAVVGETLAVPKFGYSASGKPQGPSAILISKSGHFSYHGKAQRLAGKKEKSVQGDLSGEFLSATEAQVRFAVAYGSCKPQVVRIKRAG